MYNRPVNSLELQCQFKGMITECSSYANALKGKKLIFFVKMLDSNVLYYFCE